MTPSTKRADRRSHRFGLDLLRAAAILMVVSCHTGLIGARWFGWTDPQLLGVSGFFGVEAFFVLSGFLIGRILLDTVAAEPTMATLRRFLVRRWARTLPLYYLMLALLAAFLPPDGGAAPVLPYFLTLTQNLAWKTKAFWFPVSWSLAVEEWFYLLFPLLVLILSRGRGTPAGRMAVATAVFLVVPAIGRAGLPDGVDWNDVTRQMVLLRLDAIAFGVGAALLDRSARFGKHLRIHRIRLALGGVAVLGLQWWGGLQGSDSLARRVHDVLATDIADGGWALTLFLLDALRRPADVLARPVRFVAERSYGLYLFHLPLLGIADRGIVLHGWPRAPTVAGLLAAYVVLPSVSWRFFERPILSFARRPDGRDRAGLDPRTV